MKEEIGIGTQTETAGDIERGLPLPLQVRRHNYNFVQTREAYREIPRDKNL